MDARFFTAGSFAPARSRVPTGAEGGVVAEAAGPLHDPPLEPRDEAVFLLTAAAEVEHALMAQYLYAAYSVRVAGPEQDTLQEIQDLLAQIAREEMGHLATVQNLLHLVGGPLNLGREHAPYADSVYPFRFALEPVTLGSLAKYVTAESPRELPPEMLPADVTLVEQLRIDAVTANGGHPVRHVGPIFERLATLFAGGAGGLVDADFRLDTHSRQARIEDWGFDSPLPTAEPLIIESFPTTDVASVRKAAVLAVRKIGEQGEGFDIDLEPGSSASESHFERFLAIYKSVAALPAGTDATWPVATNPNTTKPPDPAAMDAMDAVDSALEAHLAAGRVTEPRARAWAQLFDLRYRLLLGQLAHFLRLDQDLYATAAGPHRGDRTARGLLLIGTFDEMRRLKKIAGKLVQLPKDSAVGAANAGPPFGLPYTLNLPDGEPQRWRMHLDASRAATTLIGAHLDPATDPFLADLLERDVDARAIMESLAAGGDVPAGALPGGFAKVVTILDEAVRGFRIGGQHGSFWSGRTRDEFVATPVVGAPPVALNPDGSVDPDPDTAPLVERLTATTFRMPLHRPAVPADRVEYIKEWIRAGAPDDDPPGQIGVTTELSPAAEVVVPTPGAGLSFAADIQGLFRASPDRSSMLFVFDLHVYEDVRDNADGILARLEIGDMPCDDAWPAERIAVFRQWRDDGRLP